MVDAPVHVYVINLPRSTERKERISARLAALGMAFEIFPAVDGRGLSRDLPLYHGRRRRLLYGHDLTDGEIGCAVSHLAIYRDMVARGIGHALVLEDDALLSDDLPVAVAAAMRCRDQWDMVRFIASPKVKRLARLLAEEVEAPYSFARIFGTPGGAYAYLLNSGAARRLFELGQPIWLPIDTLHGQVWRSGLRVRLMLPSPVTPDFAIPSTIGDTRFDKTLQLQNWERYLYPLTRCVYKIFDLIIKRASFYGGSFMEKMFR